MKHKILVMTLIALSVLLGCQGKSGTKSLLVYTALEEDTLVTFVDLWERQYPEIRLDFIRDSSGVISARYEAELQNPQADILWAAALSSLVGYIDTFEPLEIDTSDLRPQFFDTSSEKPRWVGISAWMASFNINTVELKKLNLPSPHSYQDLLNPAYKDLIAMPNPASSGTGFFDVSAWVQLWGEEEAWKYMDALNENIHQYPHSGSAPTRMSAQGETVIGVGMGFDGLRQREQGAPLEVIFPDEGSGWEIEIVAIPKKDEIKPEAYLFAQWALAQETLQEISKIRGIVSDQTIPTTLEGYPEDINAQLMKYDFLWASENRQKLLEEWEGRYGMSQ